MIRLIPSAVSALAMICAFLACYAALYGSIVQSLGFLLLAFAADILDGAIARRYSLVSNIGKVLDSIADVPLYLLYPVAVVISLYGTSPIIVAILGIFVLSGVGRLIRFTREGFHLREGKIKYSGIPVYVSIPFVTILVASSKILLLPLWLTLAVLAILSPLMVSRIRVKKPTNSRFLFWLFVVTIGTGLTLLFA